jgi:nucleoside-diphosphate-sugar epimerase
VVPNSRILITGGTGFLGAPLAEELARRGHDVTALGSKDGDLAEPGVAERLLDLHAPDVVVHLAARVGRLIGEQDPEATRRLNVGATALLAAACAARGVRIAHGSTTEVYGALGDRVVDESTPLDVEPDTVYGRTKRDAELAVLEHLPDALLLRSLFPYGPGTAPGQRGAIVSMLDQAARGVQLTVYRDDERSWCWVGDVANAIALLVERGERGAWNVGRDDDRRSMLDVARAVCRVTGASEDLIVEVEAPAPTGSGHVSTAKLRELGWKPAVDFEDGLRKTLVSMAPR